MNSCSKQINVSLSKQTQNNQHRPPVDDVAWAEAAEEVEMDALVDCRGNPGIPLLADAITFAFSNFSSFLRRCKRSWTFKTNSSTYHNFSIVVSMCQISFFF